MQFRNVFLTRPLSPPQQISADSAAAAPTLERKGTVVGDGPQRSEAPQRVLGFEQPRRFSRTANTFEPLRRPPLRVYSKWPASGQADRDDGLVLAHRGPGQAVHRVAIHRRDNPLHLPACIERESVIAAVWDEICAAALGGGGLYLALDPVGMAMAIGSPRGCSHAPTWPAQEPATRK